MSDDDKQCSEVISLPCLSLNLSMAIGASLTGLHFFLLHTNQIPLLWPCTLILIFHCCQIKSRVTQLFLFYNIGKVLL